MPDHATKSPTQIAADRTRAPLGTASAPTPSPIGLAPDAAPHAFTFLNSFCTTILTTAIFFLTKSAYGFTQTLNLALAVLLGVTYIVGARFAGAITRRLLRTFPALSSRGILALLLLALALLCATPLVIVRVWPDTGSWPIWVVIGLYSPLTGILWPLVESFIAGGKRGDRLVRSVGLWNVNWSSAGAIASIAVAPLIANYPLESMVLLGGIHLLSGLCLPFFPAHPAPHADGPHDPHPAHYTALLVTFRMLLPAAYVASSTLMPLLPNLTESFNVVPVLSTLITAIYLATRSFTFLGFQFFRGWHGRWWPAIVCPALLIVGFGLVVFASRIGGNLGSGAGWFALVGGLVGFGVGMAGIYSGALYYALEVGNAQVDAGGAHETLIGVGYTIGPAMGLGVALAIDRGRLKPTSFEPWVLSAVAVVVVAVVLMVAVRVRQQTRSPR